MFPSRFVQKTLDRNGNSKLIRSEISTRISEGFLRRFGWKCSLLGLLLVSAAIPLPGYAGAESYRSLVKKGQELIKDKQGDEAFVVFSQAVKVNPRGSEGYSGLAWALYTRGQMEAAEKEARKATLLDPKNVAAHNVLGAVYFAQGKIAEAQEEFRTVIRLDPKRKCGGCGDLSGLLGTTAPASSQSNGRKK